MLRQSDMRPITTDITPDRRKNLMAELALIDLWNSEYGRFDTPQKCERAALEAREIRRIEIQRALSQGGSDGSTRSRHPK
jgi:hypothetical protein